MSEFSSAGEQEEVNGQRSSLKPETPESTFVNLPPTNEAVYPTQTSSTYVRLVVVFGLVVVVSIAAFVITKQIFMNNVPSNMKDSTDATQEVPESEETKGETPAVAPEATPGSGVGKELPLDQPSSEQIDLSAITDPRAKELIEQLYTDVFPEIDAITKEYFPEGKLILNEEKTKSLPPDVLSRIKSLTGQIGEISAELRSLKPEPFPTALSIHVEKAKAQVYVNGKEVHQVEASDTRNTTLRLYSEDNYGKYILSKVNPGLGNIFVLKEGENTVRITYEAMPGTGVDTEFPPVTLAVERAKEEKTPDYETVLELVADKFVEGGVTKGELTGSFILKK